MGNEYYFDFTACTELIQYVEDTLKKLMAEWGEVSDSFDKLGNYFRDEGYSNYRNDLKRFHNSFKEVIQKIASVDGSLQEYQKKLRLIDNRNDSNGYGM